MDETALIVVLSFKSLLVDESNQSACPTLLSPPEGTGLEAASDSKEMRTEYSQGKYHALSQGAYSRGHHISSPSFLPLVAGHGRRKKK